MVSMRRVPSVATELIGSGIMEWSRERDRYLNVSEGAICRTPSLLPFAGLRRRTSVEVAILAFALHLATMSGVQGAKQRLCFRVSSSDNVAYFHEEPVPRAPCRTAALSSC